MKTGIWILLAGVICFVGGFLLGQLHSGGSGECERNATELLETLEQRELLYEKVRKQNNELSKIAKAAIEKMDEIETRCSEQFMYEASVEE